MERVSARNGTLQLRRRPALNRVHGARKGVSDEPSLCATSLRSSCGCGCAASCPDRLLRSAKQASPVHVHFSRGIRALYLDTCLGPGPGGIGGERNVAVVRPPPQAMLRAERGTPWGCGRCAQPARQSGQTKSLSSRAAYSLIHLLSTSTRVVLRGARRGFLGDPVSSGGDEASAAEAGAAGPRRGTNAPPYAAIRALAPETCAAPLSPAAVVIGGPTGYY